MSVLVTIRLAGDTDQFRRFIATEHDVMQKMAEDAKSQGAIHHRFGVGDGFVIVIDEWESAEAFQTFFTTNEDMPTVMRNAGAQGEPEITFVEAIDTVDQY